MANYEKIMKSEEEPNYEKFMKYEKNMKSGDSSNYEKKMKSGEEPNYEKIMKSKEIAITPEKTTPKKRKPRFLIVGIILTAAMLISAIFLVKTLKKPSSLYLAMNTDSSVYAPNQMVRVLISAIDNNGNTLCHSNLRVVISGPKKFKTELSTKDGSITTSTTCAEDGTKTNDPDYQGSFVPHIEGTYKLKLTNLDNKETVEKKIEVKSDIPFNIERQATTRVNPSETVRYHMVLRIFSKNGFKGAVSDTVPSSFEIVWKGEAQLEDGKITWDVDLDAGETMELVYDYRVDDSDDTTHAFGPAVILLDGRKVFEEKAPWQIVEGKAATSTSAWLPTPLREFLIKFMDWS